MLHLGLKYGQMCDSKEQVQVSPPNTPRWGGGWVGGGWTEVQNEQEMRKRDKQMSAGSHQLGAGILKQNA